ncbi:MAG: fasciclin domain-containing protein [Stellaceae bacterium]
MRHTKTLLAAAAVLTLGLGGAAMAADPMVGGSPMFASKNIIQNAVNSKDHTTLVAAVKAAGLVQTLEGPGPFTVFAPTNEAFAALPPGTVDNLLKPANKATLVKILTYHVVSGRYDKAVLMHDLQTTPGGKVSLKTVEGESLIVWQKNGTLMITDAKGGTAAVTIPDVFQSNGTIMVINKVLMP